MNLSLRTKLIILFVLTAIIPLAILGLFSYQKSSGMMQEQISEGVLEKLEQINKNLTFFVRDVDQLSMYIYRNEMVQDILSKSSDRNHVEKYEDYIKMNTLFETVLGSKKWDIKIYIIGKNGDRYFTGDYLPKQYDDYMENWGIFRKAKLTDGTLAWDTHYSIRKIDQQEIVLSAGRLLKDIETDEVLGYLVIDIMESAVADIYKTDRLNQQLFLLDDQGYVISSFPNKATVGTKMSYSFLEQILGGEEGFFGTTWEAAPHVIVYDTAEDTKFKVASFVPIQNISEKNGLIRNITIAIAIIGLLCSIWIAYFLSKTVTSPLYRLISLMKKVEHGQLNVQFDTKYDDDIGVLGNSFNEMTNRLKQLIQDGYEKQVLLKESEIKALQAQINPHFLYNTLDTVNWMAKMNGLKEISSVVVSLGEMMRYSIKNGEDLVLLEEDIRHLEHYLVIQQIRYRDKFKVTMDIEEEAKKCYIPSLLLQPLVENAISHGLEMKLDEGHLSIKAELRNHCLVISIEDDGVGIDEHILENIKRNEYESANGLHTGIGLQNVQRRIQIYFDHLYDLHIESRVNEGTKIILTLPIILEKGATSDAKSRDCG
jgi:two-component system sensor histidine kinase YesM